MILKRLPEDFKVTEITKLKESPNGTHSVYLLTKNGIDTFGAIEAIKRKFRLTDKHIGVAGLKDRHAYTTQYISIFGRRGKMFDLKERSFELQFKFFANKKLRIGYLRGNKFEITVRKIHPSYIKYLDQRAMLINNGVPNYYGEQRFGSYSSKKGFIGKAIISRKYEDALKIYLTNYIKSESNKIKKMKTFFEQHWGDFGSCLKYLKTSNIRSSIKLRILQHLNYNCNDFRKVLDFIPKRELRLYIEAYQSRLWNDITRELVSKFASKTFSLTYNAGLYLFYDKIAQERLELLKNSAFNFEEVEAPNEVKMIILNLIKDLLKKEGINVNYFQNEISSIGILKLRKVVLIPKNFSISKPEKDELYMNFMKVKIKFDLPSGCYATIITRQLFKH